MKKTIFSLLFFLCTSLHAESIKLEEFKTHLRLNVFIAKDQIVITQKGDFLTFETLDFAQFEVLKSELAKEFKNSPYITEITDRSHSYPEQAAEIKMKIADPQTEIFVFYKDDEGKYVVDLWKKTANIEQTVSASKPNNISVEVGAIKKAKNIKQSEKLAVKNDLSLKVEKVEEETTKGDTNSLDKKLTHAFNEKNLYQDEFRDFRYGGTITWDYLALIPPLKKEINLKRKTPESFNHIKDRDYEKNDEEAHMQLTINLFRKGDFGLMNKSIDLYQQKYGLERNEELNTYLKATALLKDYLLKEDFKNVGIKKMALAMYENIAEKTKDYDLQKVLFQYLIEDKIENNSFLLALQYAKKLYVAAKNNVDNDVELYSLMRMLYSLAKMSQKEKLEELLRDRSVTKIVPEQERIAYLSFSYLEQNDPQRVVDLIEKQNILLQKPVHPSILYNLGEAYFRLAQYDKAVQYFRQFEKDYSHLKESASARMRASFATDLRGEKPQKVMDLYQDTINRSSVPEIRYEAKLRFLGVALARKRQLTEKDEHYFSLFQQRDDEKNVLSNDLKKLLWQVRLRTFINKKKYEDALVYLKSLPFMSMKASEVKTFLSDATEIVHGLIGDAFSEGDYSKVVRLWERNKDEYFDNVPKDLSVGFLVAYSYMKLGLNQTVDKFLDELTTYKGPYKNFPHWVEDQEIDDAVYFITEIRLLREISGENWEKAMSLVDDIDKQFNKPLKMLYYRAYISYRQQKFDETITFTEEYLISNKESKIRLNNMEIANLFSSYIESIYKKEDHVKFIKTADAIIKDIQNIKSNSPSLRELKQRVLYLQIETIYGHQKDDDSEKLLTYIEMFIKDFKKTIYSGRVQYLWGLIKLQQGLETEAEKILGDIVKDDSIPNYIRELSKSELSTLIIKRQKI